MAPPGHVQVIHHLHGGFTPCGMKGVPRDWPAGNLWSSNWEEVDCSRCLATRPPLMEDLKPPALAAAFPNEPKTWPRGKK